MLVRVKKSGIWNCELSTEKLTWSAHTYDLFEIKLGAELRRRDIIDMYADGCRERVEAIRTYAIRSKKSFTVDVSIWTPASERRWLRIDGKALGSHLASSRLLGTKQDITNSHSERLRSRNLIGHDPITGLLSREAFERGYAELQDEDEYESRSHLSIELINRKAIVEDHGMGALEQGLFAIAGQIIRIVDFLGSVFVLSPGLFAVIIRSAEQVAIQKLIESLRMQLKDPIFYGGTLLFPQINVEARPSHAKL